MTKNDQKNEEDFFDLKVIDPAFVEAVKQSYKEQQLEPNLEVREKLFEMAKDYKKRAIKEGTLNNSDWLRLLEPIITPIRDLRKLFGLDGFSISSLRVAAMVVIVSVVGGLSYVVYSQYQNIGHPKPGLIVDHQIPATSTNSTPVPSPIPNPGVTPTPNAGGNRNNDIIKNQKQPNKTKKPKSNPLNGTIDDNQVAHNTKPKDFITEDTSNSTREIEKVKKDVTLSEVKTIYIASFGDEEKDKDLRKAIISKFSSDSRFKLLKPIDMVKNKADAVLKKKNGFLRLTDGVNGKILWEKELKDSMSSSFEESAREIFDELTRESH
jgi:hypothetical protein